jgi:hypothetical protein
MYTELAESHMRLRKLTIPTGIINWLSVADNQSCARFEKTDLYRNSAGGISTTRTSDFLTSVQRKIITFPIGKKSNGINPHLDLVVPTWVSIINQIARINYESNFQDPEFQRIIESHGLEIAMLGLYYCNISLKDMSGILSIRQKWLPILPKFRIDPYYHDNKIPKLDTDRNSIGRVWDSINTIGANTFLQSISIERQKDYPINDQRYQFEPGDYLEWLKNGLSAPCPIRVIYGDVQVVLMSDREKHIKFYGNYIGDSNSYTTVLTAFPTAFNVRDNIQYEFNTYGKPDCPVKLAASMTHTF